MELKVPKGLTLGLHYPLSWSNGFSRFKCQGAMAEKCHFNICNCVFLGSNVTTVTMKEGEKKGRCFSV